MTRTRFDDQLEELHVELIKMGSLCEEAISLSAQALEKNEEKTKERVFALETEIDQMEREVETHCMRLLLHQQPVARDLRAISAALKMISDMERIGDQAADIVELVPYIAQSECKNKVNIAEMAKATVSMVTDSVEAFVKKDLKLAEQVIEKDDVVDEMFASIKKKLMELVRSQNVDAEPALDLLMAAKYFERIGDHAVNVAEWVEYSVTGIHKSSEHHLGN
ncbi:MAG: phosphate signaling complex protein PhoU [Eubacteriales bacterium]|nr:phosphate signaling complex protein PhoU [Eubacteriales bacterium]